MTTPTMHEVIHEIRTSRSTILEAIDKYTRSVEQQHEVSHAQLREIITELQRNLTNLAHDASKGHVTLKLDDLFRAVTLLVKSAQSIDAVDIEVDRWGTDNRAVDYLAASVQALRRGAQIRRVYIISPGLSDQNLDQLIETVREHEKLNGDPDIQRARGEIKARILYHEDVPRDCLYKDFAIFTYEDQHGAPTESPRGLRNSPAAGGTEKDRLVLFEEFDGWRTTHRGDVTIVPDTIARYRVWFDKLWRKASPLPNGNRFEAWRNRIRKRMAGVPDAVDLFLGYCSKAAWLAREVREILERNGYSVLSWEEFHAGETILDRIADADRRCMAGVFLFTRDDPLEGEEGKAAPRDNVVFEAGYFMRSKAAGRILIIREEGTKWPADLSSHIYVGLDDRNDVASIQDRVLDWAEKCLGSVQ